MPCGTSFRPTVHGRVTGARAHGATRHARHLVETAAPKFRQRDDFPALGDRSVCARNVRHRVAACVGGGAGERLRSGSHPDSQIHGGGGLGGDGRAARLAADLRCAAAVSVGMTPAHRAVVQSSEYALYACLLVQPATGLGASLFNGRAVRACSCGGFRNCCPRTRRSRPRFIRRMKSARGRWGVRGGPRRRRSFPPFRLRR